MSFGSDINIIQKEKIIRYYVKRPNVLNMIQEVFQRVNTRPLVILNSQTQFLREQYSSHKSKNSYPELALDFEKKLKKQEYKK